MQGTVIQRDARKPLSDYAGLPYAHVTWEGVTINGVTAINPKGQLIVNLPTGQWAFACFEFIGA